MANSSLLIYLWKDFNSLRVNGFQEFQEFQELVRGFQELESFKKECEELLRNEASTISYLKGCLLIL